MENCEKVTNVFWKDRFLLTNKTNFMRVVDKNEKVL